MSYSRYDGIYICTLQFSSTHVFIAGKNICDAYECSMVFARFEQKNVDKLHTQEQPPPPTKLSQKLLGKKSVTITRCFHWFKASRKNILIGEHLFSRGPFLLKVLSSHMNMPATLLVAQFIAIKSFWLYA